MSVKNQNHLKALSIAAVLVISGCSNGNSNSAKGGSLDNPEPPTSGNFRQVFADEFDGDGLDASVWEIQEGDGSDEGIPGWGNNELQYYTADNVSVVDGNLVIEARAGDSPVSGFDFTSARIRTQGNLDFTYGRVEASIQVPPGVGLWAAFWTLGSDPSVYGEWAAKGEIDILESFGGDTPFLQGAAHYGMEFPLNQLTFKRYEEIDPTDGFHQYAVEWDINQIRWYVDGQHYLTLQKSTYWSYYYDGMMNGFVEGGESAPFDEDQYVILNMAVGGDLPGDPTDPSVFPAQMLVDYVRIYECPVDPENTGSGCDNSIDPVDPFLINEFPAADVFVNSFDFYVDGLQSLFEGTGSERALNLDVFDNDGALTVTEVTTPEGGTAIDILTTGGGNVSVKSEDGGGFNLQGMGSSEVNSGRAGGEIKFDLKIISGTETDANGLLQVRMDSGFPDVGYLEIALADLPQDEFVTLSFPVSDILQSNQGAFGGEAPDVENISSLVTFEPTSAAHLQVNNIELVCGAPEFCAIEAIPIVSLELFINEVDPLWARGIRGFDTLVDDDYSDSSGNHVSWTLPDTGEEGQDIVIEATFDDNGASGLIFIGAPEDEVIDISTYVEGELVFDVRVLDNPNNLPIQYKVDGLAGQGTGERSLGVLESDVWQTFNIPVSTLVAQGLTLTEVTAFVLLPTFSGQDIVFQFDNVRFDPVASEPPPSGGISYSSDFEAADPNAGEIGDGWISFVTVFDGAGGFLYNYGPFASPNGTGAISTIDGGEGGAAQGDQYLNVFSDYNNGDQASGALINPSTFQETIIAAGDSGTYRLSFDAKAPSSGGIAPPTTAEAFIKTLDPVSGFAVTSEVTLDISGVSSTDWATYTLDLSIDAAALEGQILQFGFSNTATNFDPSAISIDNVDFSIVAPPSEGISYTADFEGSDAGAAEIGDGWTTFVNVTDSGGGFVYGYGSFPSPNNTGAITQISTGEGSADQGMQYLSVFSDYNNADHGNGLTINPLTFQERTIGAGDGGTYQFSFDAKAAETGGMAPPSTGYAFIKTLDPGNNFATTSEVRFDMSSVSNTDWASFVLELAVDAGALQGQLLQFGFSNSATNFDPTAIYYDNIDFGTGGSAPPAEPVSYAADFESSDPAGSEVGDGWTTFVDVTDSGGASVYGYGPFASPNNTGSITQIATGEEGPDQGAQYLNVFSDYNNADHGNGLTITPLTFQERVLTADDTGDFRLSFDAKAPGTGGIAPPTTAYAFIKVLDPNSGFSVTSEIRLDMSAVGNTDWASFMVDLTIDGVALQGQLLQFGFANSATNYDPSGIFYDNIVFGISDGSTPPPPPSGGGGDGLPGNAGATGGPLSTDFESGSTVFEDFGDPIPAISMLVADPLDASNTVASTFKGAGTPLWAGTTVDEGTITYPLTMTNSQITVRVYSPDAGIPVRLKVEDASDPTRSVETEAVTTSFNGWETLTFDFNNQAPGTAALNESYTFNKMSIFFNFGTDGDTAGDKTYLWDTIEFVSGSAPPPAVDPVSYAADFEGSDAAAGAIGDGWTTFVEVSDSVGTPIYNYGAPFPSPNNTGAITQIATGEEGPDQGAQYLNVFSDYNNADHGNGLTITPLTFQERVLTADDTGDFRLSFDAKAPGTGGIAPPTTAYAFIKTLDPNAGFVTTSEVQLDMTGVSNTDWASFSVDLSIDGVAFEGQLLQFGFANSATNYDPSGIFYDNITFGLGTGTPPPPPGPMAGGDGLPGSEGATGGPLSTDFESGGTVFEDFGDPVSVMTMLVVDPELASNTVASTLKGLGTPLWAGTTVDAGTITYPLTASNSQITVRVYSPDAGIPVRLKVEDAADPTRSVETEAVTTSFNGWETLTFDFNNQAPGTAALNESYTYNKLSIFFNFGTDGDTAGEKTYLWDTIEFVAGVAPPPPPPPVGGGDGLSGSEGATGGPFSTDFESGSTVFEDFGDPVSIVSMLIADPVDVSNTVASALKGTGTPLWAGTTVDAGTITYPITMARSQITVRVYSPDAGIPVRLKVEDASDPTRSVETEAVTTSFDGWETLTFDFNNEAPGTAALNESYTFNKLSIFFNFGTDGDTAGEKTYLWDTIEFP